MLTALTEDGTKVYASEVNKTDKQGNKIKYYCPECHSELILRQGTKNMWHFAHKDNNGVCIFRKYDNESYYHKVMKTSVKTIIEKDMNCLVSELEQKIGSKIADYYFEITDKWNNIKRVAVECVHSHTDIDVFRHKNEYYAQQGVFVLWIFNLNRFLDKDNDFKDEVRINEIIKECHTMYFGKVYAVDIYNKVIYGIHLDSILREVEEQEIVDWSEWIDGEYQENYFEEHTHTVGGYEYYLNRTKRPNPRLIKPFVINSFKRAWDKHSLSFLPYKRNVANVYVQKWW